MVACREGIARVLSPPAASVGEWLSLVEHLVRDQGVGGSNPLSPTIFLSLFQLLRCYCYFSGFGTFHLRQGIFVRAVL
jgi:hypothetical protein